MNKEDLELKIRKIKQGTVIDHIPPGKSLKVLKIIGISEKTPYIVSVGMNVPSKKIGKKDIVKVENKELSEKETNKLALIAPDATINIIENYKVTRKYKVSLPSIIEGIIKCPNPNCISNHERILPKFIVERRKPLKLRCYYCERVVPGDRIDTFAL